MLADAALRVGIWIAVGWLLGIGASRLAYRIPREQAPFGHPTCDSCGTPIPILGLTVKGTCAACKNLTHYDHIEWPLAVLFGILAVTTVGIGQLVAHSADAVGLILIAVMDLRHRYVYTIVSAPLLLVALVFSPLLGGISWQVTVKGCLVGTGIFLVFYLGGRLMYRGGEPMGRGDVTIAAIIGAMVGFPLVLDALFIGSIASALLGFAIMTLQRKGRRAYVAYGPGLCIGALVTLFLPT